MPCRPPIMFWRTVGHARRHTAREIGPSTIDRSNLEGGAASAGGAAGAGTSVAALATGADGVDSMQGFYQAPLYLNVSHAFGSPVSRPRLNHVTRCSDVPWVNFSGMIRPVARRW